MHSRTTRRRTFTTLLAGALVLAGGVAHADAIGMPPEDCPDGTRGQSSHCGLHCDAALCADDSECGDGELCVLMDLCVVELDCMSGGGPFTHESVEGHCGGGGSCDSGTCESLRVCSDPDAASAGCGCRMEGSPGAASAAGVGLIMASTLALLLASRRRRF